MKKISLFLLAFAAIATTFTSCGEDDPKAIPVVSFQDNLISSDKLEIQLASGETSKTVSFIINFEAEAEIQTGELKETVGSSVNYISDFTAVVEEFEGETSGFYNFSKSLVAGTYTYEATVTDKDGEKGAKILTVVVKAAGGAITTTTATIMGDQDSTVGSACSATGTVYSKTAAAAASSSVDFIYYVAGTTTFNYELISPSYATTGYPSYVTGWTTKNATKFELTTLTTAQFDAISDDSAIKTYVPTADKIENLTASKVIAFKTGAGKSGLFKVTDVVTKTATVASKITIVIKVQQ